MSLTGVLSFLRDSLAPPPLLGGTAELSFSLETAVEWGFCVRRTLEEEDSTRGGGADCAGAASVMGLPKRAELRVRPGTTGVSALPLICGCVCRKEGARDGPAGVGGAALSNRGGAREETRLFLSGLEAELECEELLLLLFFTDCLVRRSVCSRCRVSRSLCKLWAALKSVRIELMCSSNRADNRRLML